MAKKRSPTPYSFGFGFVQSRAKLRVIAQIDKLADTGETASRVMTWTAKDGKWSQSPLNWTAVRIWASAEPPELYVLGPDGEIVVASRSAPVSEAIDETMQGPQGRGPLRDLRRIGERLCVAGMSRQVYWREGTGDWRHRDEGTILPLGSRTVAGFNSIDGLSEDDYFAAGFGGEIWRCLNGSWRQLDSPTNVVLHRVKVVQKNLIYASGQGGVLLRGNGDAWEQIDHGMTEDDLWDVEWYRDRLYLAHDEGLFVLGSGDSLQDLNFGLPGRITCRHLHSNDGVLLSSGPKNILWTNDGKTWQDITP